ncbi:MAG: T9SS type B sorting domain-containing protein [Lacinutrix sp.]|uniref:T9SS type B sorting domain-containing protein n=1 Tax=Lacinutrix sp. TaxID=1937692 RepID=UPI0030A83CA7
MQPTNLECWKTATFNTTSCVWEITGTQVIDVINIELSICNEDTLILEPNTSIQNPQYQWITAEQTSSIEIENSGTYSVEVTDGCALEITNFTVTSNVTPIIASVESVNHSIIITTSTQANYQYSLDGINYQNDNIFTNMPNGLYSAYVRSLECNVEITQQHLHFYIPQFFTPNGDGVNDYFALNDLEYFNSSKVIIFNRFGKLLFATKNRSVRWDGTLNGHLLPTADYWYLITIEGIEFKGHFTLKR